MIGTEVQDEAEEKKVVLTSNLEENIRMLSARLGRSPDINIRRLKLGSKKKLGAVVIFVDGLIDQQLISDHILGPLMRCKVFPDEKGTIKTGKILELVKDQVITVGGVKEDSKPEDVVCQVLSGDTALLVEGVAQALVLSTKGWQKRAIEEPDIEVIVKGPRDGFVETLRTNTALLRRRIRHPNLTFECLEVGKKTRTEVCLAYLRGLTNPKLVEEVKRRLRRINTDAILAGGFLEEFIEDAPLSPFPTVAYTERPDVAAAKIIEGRVAILIDGTPAVNTVPALFIESFQNPDDYNYRPYYTTVVRWVRYVAFFLSVLSPAIYVALTTFHQELIPTSLLISMAAASEGTPLPTVLEAVGLGLVFELLREAGIRLPRPIGQTVSIVGALVIGDAVVTAGLVSATSVIVVALTAISSFVVPVQVGVAVLLRLSLTIVAGALGAFGVVIVLLAVLVHLASLRSFGVPYLSPLAPLVPRDLKDVLIRAPLWTMVTRPQFIGGGDPQRQEFRLRPEVPRDVNEKKGDQDQG